MPAVPDFGSMSEEEQIAMAMQMSLQADEASGTPQGALEPPGAPKKPSKKKEDNENKNNSTGTEDRKRPRESEGAGGSNPTTPGRQGETSYGSYGLSLYREVLRLYMNRFVYVNRKRGEETARCYGRGRERG